MLKTIKQRLGRDDEQGFTLIELMVVVLIIAILLAIAIPTFLSARNSANARSAQSDLRNSITAEQEYWTNNQSFTDVPATIKGIESSINWVNAAATTTVPNTVNVLAGDGGNAVMVQAQGHDGKCYTVEVSNDPAASFTGYNVATGNCAALAAFTTNPAAPTVGSATGAGVTAGTFYQSW
jgi:type IV pilus assembly protein PilA